MLKYIELQKMSIKDLVLELYKANYAKGKLFFLIKSGQQEKIAHKYGKAKKYVAQIQTLISEIRNKK